MRLAYTSEQAAFQEELRDYFRGIHDRFGRPIGLDHAALVDWHRAVVAALGADRLLGLSWPTEFGGQARPWMDDFILFDEAQRAHVPMPMISLNTVGPALMKYGTPEQRQKYLPKIVSGEAEFSIGYTEPSAGTDLASLTTRAVLDGSHYVVNGAKIYTSGAEVSRYIWLAVRTQPEAPKHRGLSVLIVPTAATGVRVVPLPIMGERARRTTQTFYDDVSVPVADRVGTDGEGWAVMTSQLNRERVTMAAAGGSAIGSFHDVCQWARTECDGVRPIDRDEAATTLARAYIRLRVMQLHNWRVAAEAGAGRLKPELASTTKVFGTETIRETAKLLMRVVGRASTLREDDPDAPFEGVLEYQYQAAIPGTFGGGNNDIQREMIVVRGLDMRRAPR